MFVYAANEISFMARRVLCPWKQLSLRNTQIRNYGLFFKLPKKK